MKTCGNCKWWDTEGWRGLPWVDPDRAYRRCKNPHSFRAWDDKAGFGCEHTDDSVLTGPEFGCVHHEEES